jgi:hypothetical protein
MPYTWLLGYLFVRGFDSVTFTFLTKIAFGDDGIDTSQDQLTLKKIAYHSTSKRDFYRLINNQFNK